MKTIIPQKNRKNRVGSASIIRRVNALISVSLYPGYYVRRISLTASLDALRKAVGVIPSLDAKQAER